MSADSKANGHGLYHSTVATVHLDHLKSHAMGRDLVGLFNDCGFVVRARAESGEDIHLWMFTYQQRGSETIIDGDIGMTAPWGSVIVVILAQRDASDPIRERFTLR